MRGRYFDGRSAGAADVDVEVAEERLTFSVADVAQSWPISSLRVEDLGQQLRLSLADEDARLIVDSEAYSREGGIAVRGHRRRARKKERRLIVGLAAAGLALTALVFIGVPAASGPLARATPPRFERQIGKNFEAQLGVAFPTCSGMAGQKALYAFGERLKNSDAGAFDIRVRAVEAPFVNAFALPGGAVLVTDDLISLAETPDELAAVIAHEVAHVQERHVMKSVWRSLGVGLILDAFIGGGTGAGQQAVLLAANITDLSFSRETEVEADAVGRALLHQQGLSSQGMAPFFQRLASKDEGEDAALVKELVSSHPASLRRARIASLEARPGAAAFSEPEWKEIKAACRSGKGDGLFEDFLKRVRPSRGD